ncbi:hypothetical protein MLD38_027506 [Melastoma candidum]|uniref:Uncharacterized protein n=1 Tax=Melastoma candidum TaxID=119954 RepID=A0ACB9P2Y8_9MYRT|nr:hypothetical protein MLD38_027506 [Melastoma candidum]
MATPTPTPTHHPPPDIESGGGGESLASSPRSEPQDLPPRLRFMCSFGGKILPRPHDNQLRYVGGDTRIVAFGRGTSFSALLAKLSKLSGTTNITVKYQLPNEDLDALISVTTDEDVDNMLEEYDRFLSTQTSRSARLRLFLFNKGDDSRHSSISSLLDGSSNREQWFFDALNGGGPPSAHVLERGRSEASSIVSEVPDYLFGLDNSDENQPRGDPKLRTRAMLSDHVPGSDPGSPLPPVAPSPYGSTSSAPIIPSMPDLPPVKTRPEIMAPKPEVKEVPGQTYVETGETILAQPAGYALNPSTTATHHALTTHYSAPPLPHMPVYYIPGSIPPTNMPVQPMMARPHYVPQYPTSAGQVPVAYQQPVHGGSQAYAAMMRPPVAMDPGRIAMDGMIANVNPQVYYGMSGSGMIPAYPPMPGMVVPIAGTEDMPGSKDRQDLSATTR